MSGREQCCDHILSRGHSTCALRGTQAQSARPGRSDDQRDQNNSFRCNNSGTSVAESLSHKAGSFDWNEFVGPFSNSIAKLAGTKTTQTKGKTSPRVASSTQSEFPTAKPVPGKPGYVFSPFDPKGRYVDVSGYTPGSKVKDPWTDKIFVVP